MNNQSALRNIEEMPKVERYSQKGNPGFEAIMARRTAAKEGAFFLKNLRPGMSVLDVGCGPGSITLGFAEAVGTGEVVGVDIQESQVSEANKLSIERKLNNVRFEVGDAYHLPFPDKSFDAVFAYAVLWHLREPLRALAEIRRILRPGGIVGICDCDWGGRIHAPMTPMLEKWYELTVRVRKHNGGNPFLGRKLRQLFLDAGFEIGCSSVFPWSAGTPEQIELCATFLKAQLKGFASTAQTQGWISQAETEVVSANIDAWAKLPEAFYLDIYCETLGRLVS